MHLVVKVLSFFAPLIAVLSLSGSTAFGVQSDLWCKTPLVPNENPKVFHVTEVSQNIFNLVFTNRRDMAATFVRFQEHYESPSFRGKTFSKTQFKKWYRTQKNGKFSYYRDWSGFNIPSYVLNAFYEGSFRFKTDREKALLDQFESLHRSGQKFYIVGTLEGHTVAVNHEVAHGLYYINPDYKKAVDKILATVDLTAFHKWISSIGYHDAVLDDEAHAFLATEGASRLIRIGLDPAPYADAISKLQLLWMQYSGRSLEDK